MKLSVLMTVYNEADFVEYAIKSCLPYVDHLVVVEGAYQEMINLGASPRSTDGTLEKITEELCTIGASTEGWFEYINANEKTDKDQRNVGLKKIKELNPDGWLLIVDGDEVYEPNTFSIIENFCSQADKSGIVHAAYFTSMTFVNDFEHFTYQKFPRLFKITPECEFVNDNFMSWKNVRWEHPHILMLNNIKYLHYSFVKGVKKFEQKRNWWMNRGLGKSFDYGWHIDKNGQITDENHKIFLYEGKHPDIMKTHPLMKKI